MRNYQQPGSTLTLPAPYDVRGGDVAIVGAFIGVVCGDALNGTPMDMDVEGVFRLPKVATDVVTPGARLYFDTTARLATLIATGNTLLGVAIEAAGNPSATVAVRLNESF